MAILAIHSKRMVASPRYSHSSAVVATGALGLVGSRTRRCCLGTKRLFSSHSSVGFGLDIKGEYPSYDGMLMC